MELRRDLDILVNNPVGNLCNYDGIYSFPLHDPTEGTWDTGAMSILEAEIISSLGFS
jgi:hypothetical protein